MMSPRRFGAYCSRPPASSKTVAAGTPVSAAHSPALVWKCSGGHAGAGGGGIASTQPVSAGEAQSAPLSLIVEVQHAAPPPGRALHPEPPHAPQARSQQIFTPPDVTAMPHGQKPPAASQEMGDELGDVLGDTVVDHSLGDALGDALGWHCGQSPQLRDHEHFSLHVCECGEHHDSHAGAMGAADGGALGDRLGDTLGEPLGEALGEAVGEALGLHVPGWHSQHPAQVRDHVHLVAHEFALSAHQISHGVVGASDGSHSARRSTRLPKDASTLPTHTRLRLASAPSRKLEPSLATYAKSSASAVLTELLPSVTFSASLSTSPAYGCRSSGGVFGVCPLSEIVLCVTIARCVLCTTTPLRPLW